MILAIMQIVIKKTALPAAFFNWIDSVCVHVAIFCRTNLDERHHVCYKQFAERR